MSLDQRLIRDCRKNSRKAQNELFGCFKGLVMSISRRYSNNVENCEDVFQECFIQIFKSLTKTKVDISNLDAWIARIAINTNISFYYKSGKVKHEAFEGDVLDESHKDVLDQISNKELMDCISEIPDGYRVIFNLYFIDGYKHREIAQMLKISESTSRSQLTRAKEYLRKKLESQGICRYEAS
ncbi:MAG: RNA polymerase sigma factor [Cyclobacteriaceae bacterium]